MKVLEEGPGWSIEAVCTGVGNGGAGCGSKLLIEEGDIFRTESYAMGESTTYATFTCCKCNVDTDLSIRQVPSRIWDKMKKKSRGDG
jgi:hypothetical protein